MSPRQNRVTPSGVLIATPARGTLMGNRGCLHDHDQRIRRRFATKRWIVCLLEFRGIHRSVMAPGRYTELFFLDEATALAAGHRPCAECQRPRYRLFQAAWARAHPERGWARPPGADEMDRVLHAERLAPGGAKQSYVAPAAGLPNGSMVIDEAGQPYLVLDGRLLAWHPDGYEAIHPTIPGPRVRVLTPRSTVTALTAGYPVSIHPSASNR